MTRSASPAFQFYPADFLADENQIVMSLEEAGVYIRLMCVEWKQGSIPASVEKLAKLAGTTPAKMRKLWPALAPCFRVREGDETRLFHPRLEKEREKQAEFAEKMSKAGKKSGEARQPKPNVGSTNVEHGPQPDPNVDPTLQSSVFSLQSLPTPESNPSAETENSGGRFSTSNAPPVEKPPVRTINAVAWAAHEVLGLGKWGDEFSAKYADTRSIINRHWVAGGVSLDTVYAAIHGLRKMVDRGDVEWLADRKGKPLDGLEVLLKNAVVPGPDGTQMRPLFQLATEAHHERDKDRAPPSMRIKTGPSRLNVEFGGAA